jgi:Tol biopolymer transport system component
MYVDLQNSNQSSFLFRFHVNALKWSLILWSSMVLFFENHAGASIWDYRLEETKILTDEGGRVDWSPDNQWIYFDRKGQDGYRDLYRIRPQGFDCECLTCDRPELPNKHIGNPAVDPSGRYIVFQAQKEEHAAIEAVYLQPGGGVFNDLWVLDLDTDSFHQLTDVRADSLSGSLHPVFSHDGLRLFWSDLEGSGGRFGDHQLIIADFLKIPEPMLGNLNYYNPGNNPTWFESHGWGPNDAWVYFSCTIFENMEENYMDICRMSLDDPNSVKRLTFTSGIGGELRVWDEHCHLSPKHDVFSWISSWPFPVRQNNRHWRWLKTEIWLMNIYGTRRRRISSFNSPSHPDYLGQPVITADHCWSSDGNKIAVYLQLPDTHGHQIWLLSFSVD